MATLKELQAARDTALEAARAISNTGTRDEQHAATQKVVALQRAISDAITAGANPCTGCRNMPHGIEQPRATGVAYDVGCISGCDSKKYVVHGALLPRHAVEAWNELCPLAVKPS